MIFRSLLWIAREVEQAAENERAEDKEAIVAEIRGLMARLESGEIDEDTYEEREAALIDRLEEFDEG